MSIALAKAINSKISIRRSINSILLTNDGAERVNIAFRQLAMQDRNVSTKMRQPDREIRLAQ